MFSAAPAGTCSGASNRGMNVRRAGPLTDENRSGAELAVAASAGVRAAGTEQPSFSSLAGATDSRAVVRTAGHGTSVLMGFGGVAPTVNQP
jgi:hypothetical protein